MKEIKKIYVTTLENDFGINQPLIAKILKLTTPTVNRRKMKQIPFSLEELHKVYKYIDEQKDELEKQLKFFWAIFDGYLKK